MAKYAAAFSFVNGKERRSPAQVMGCCAGYLAEKALMLEVLWESGATLWSIADKLVKAEMFAIVKIGGRHNGSYQD